MVLVTVPSWRDEVRVKRKLNRQELFDATIYLHNLILFEVLKINYKAYVAKAKGQMDSFGEQWTPLHEKTIKWKRRKKLLYSGKVAINIRYRKLLKALKPNKFVNGRYVPSPNQQVTITSRSIRFEVTIEYAEAVDNVRPIFIEDMGTCVKIAMKKSIPQFQRYLKTRGLA